MSQLQQQTPTSEREMPALRCLRLGIRRPETWLAGLLAAVLLFAADGLRPPQEQVGARLFALSVDGYHGYLHPVTALYVRCRYRPTCSNYAVDAVRKYGVFKGGWMSVRRIASYRSSVPMGTNDPVP
jgi:putative membrane protein insertion efficiency factor